MSSPFRRRSRARASPAASSIAICPAGKRRSPFACRWATARFPKADIYDAAAAQILAEAKAGSRVAVLCEGDPFFYGSFMYLYARLAGRCAVAVVPGVSSLTACAAASGGPLGIAQRNSDGAARASARGRAEGPTGRGRGGGHRQGRPALRQDSAGDPRVGPGSRAHYVERATLANQRLSPACAR